MVGDKAIVGQWINADNPKLPVAEESPESRDRGCKHEKNEQRKDELKFLHGYGGRGVEALSVCDGLLKIA